MSAFPSLPFFLDLQRRLGDELAALGTFDVTFGVRVRPDRRGGPEGFVVLGFEVDACTRVEPATGDGVPAGVDFVLDAPYPIWREMLESRATPEVDSRHSINSLVHFDFPMRVAYADPAGHDKLYCFQESVQRVFDVAAKLHAAG